MMSREELKEIADASYYYILYVGHAPNGQEVYVYMSVRGDNLKKFQSEEEYIKLTEIGEILGGGFGTPPDEVMKEMEEKYNINHDEIVVIDRKKSFP